MSEPRFLEVAPEGFEITCELKWIPATVPFYGENKHVIGAKDIEILCQKWQGAFRSVWVRIPSE